jgi:hypothetical protein
MIYKIYLINKIYYKNNSNINISKFKYYINEYLQLAQSGILSILRGFGKSGMQGLCSKFKK